MPSIRPRKWNLLDVGLHATPGQILSLPEARRRLRATRRGLRRRAVQYLDKGAELLETTWKRHVRERAFATGRYHDSIRREVTGDLEVHVGSDAVNPDDGYPYPIALEYGTSRMVARPTWRPTIDEVGEEALSLVQAGYFSMFEEMLNHGRP